MAVISGILKDPIGGPRVGVVIELRAVRTSATVVNQARSQSITDAAGKYTLTVEPGAYDVMVTAGGRQPERVGGITVALNSQNGTLNDFLTMPGEADLTPEIVDTVDRMRADAAASAAAAKTSEINAAATLVDALTKSTTAAQTITSNVTIKGGLTSYGDHIMQANASAANVLLRFRNSSGIEQGAFYSQTDTGQLNIRWAGQASQVNFKPDGTVTFPSTVYSGSTALLKTGDYGIGGFGAIKNFTTDTDLKDFIRNPGTGSQILRNNEETASAPRYAAGMLLKVADTWSLWSAGTLSRGVRVAVGNTAGGQDEVYELWTNKNTTVDANGFLKKASPIVKLFGDGTSELNDQSEGVTTERVSEGVYRVSGVMGFNSDPAWGGPNGGIGLPKDNNDLTLIWVDYEVNETGDLLIKTFHRINSTAPKFAQNIVAGYKEGQPIDIPAGRWIDLRVEMPADDELEPVPETEQAPEVVPEPDADQQPDVETDQPAELEQGDTPEAETKE